MHAMRAMPTITSPHQKQLGLPGYYFVIHLAGTYITGYK